MSDVDVDPAVTPLAEWLDRLSQASGAPGGGAATAVMTAMSAALLGMVAGYSGDAAQPVAERVRRIRSDATSAAETDGVHSAAFGSALGMEEGDERERAVREAAVSATESALSVGALAASLIVEAESLARIGNRHVDADLLVACEALQAALASSAITVRSNLEVLAKHRQPEDGLDQRVFGFESALAELSEIRVDVKRIIASRGDVPS